MVDKQKVVVVLLIVAILFSVVSTVLTLSLLGDSAKFRLASPQQTPPKVVYTGKAILGNPNSGVGVTVLPRGTG